MGIAQEMDASQIKGLAPSLLILSLAPVWLLNGSKASLAIMAFILFCFGLVGGIGIGMEYAEEHDIA